MFTNLYQHVGNVRGQKLMQVGTDRNLAIVSYHAQFHIYCDKVRYDSMVYQPPSEILENVWPSHTKRFVCCAITI